jgi:hypothetical protein
MLLSMTRGLQGSQTVGQQCRHRAYSRHRRKFGDLAGAILTGNPGASRTHAIPPGVSGALTSQGPPVKCVSVGREPLASGVGFTGA